MAISFNRKTVFYALGAAFWLPIAVALPTVPNALVAPPGPAVWLSLLPTIPAGMPLAAACYLIRRTGRSRAATTTFILAGFVTVLAALVGGLFGPIGILAYCLVASIPAWLVLGFYKAIDARKRKQ